MGEAGQSDAGLDGLTPTSARGLEMVRTGYLLSLKNQPAPVIDGFTGGQRFFPSFAQVRRAKSRGA